MIIPLKLSYFNNKVIAVKTTHVLEKFAYLKMSLQEPSAFRVLKLSYISFIVDMSLAWLFLNW